MNRFLKTVALFLAMLMLVTMATACKKSNDEIDQFLTNNSTIGGSEIQNGNNDPSGDVQVDENEEDQANDIVGDNQSEKDDGVADEKPQENKPESNPNKPEEPADPNGSSADDKVDADKQEELEQNYDAAMKWDAVNNPLLAESKAPNVNIEPSFDIDTTGFVKNGIKIADLKGKTLTLITSIRYSTFQYRGENGENYNEWTWFDALKKTYGLNLKYIESRFDKSVQQSLTYMNSGKALDIIPTHRAGFPQFLSLSQPIDPYVNMQYIDNSPGVDSRMLQQTRWGGTYRCIAPMGCVDVIWYNQDLVNQLQLRDPHTLWQQGNWNWNTWKDFLVSVPKTTPDGKGLLPWSLGESEAMFFWPLTNGIDVIANDTEAEKPNLINNFEDSRCMDAWTFYVETVKGVDYLNRPGASGSGWDNLWTTGQGIMASTTNLMNNWEQFEYAKTHKYNWVPYPAAPNEGGTCVAMNYGYSWMIPKKVKNTSNIPYAVKLAELWANRFTEAIFDYLKTSPYLDFSYDQRKEYFNFTTTHNYFAVGQNTFASLTGSEGEYVKRFKWSFYNPSYNVRTQAEELKNLISKSISEMLAFGN